MRPLVRLCARNHAGLGALLGALVALVAGIYGARVAGGSDSYGYVSQADLWLRGSLKLAQDFAADAPWPDARWTFVPLGYRPEPDGYAIVPQYAPGLPLLMAGARIVGGQWAMFQVVPLMAGLLVWATYAIGRGLGRPLIGLAAAWLVATSPVVLHRAMWPMSDVPVAACWALAIAGVLRDTRRGAIAAGVAAAVAIAIRPNLVPIAGVVAIWMLWREVVRGAGTSRRPWCWTWFSVFASMGAVFIGLFNSRLYGSPLSSGYVGVTDLFSRAHVVDNLRRYGGWLIGSETPLAVAGLAALLLPLAALWPTAHARQARWLLALCAAVVWASYLPYEPFDSWWYLRFLLPAWPMMAIGTASLLAWRARANQGWGAAIAVTLLVGVGAVGVTHAARTDAFAVQRGEFKYAHVAQAVRAMTPHDAVILSQQHSGTLRYYGGRMTMRWDSMDADWIDRAVEWLATTGHHPYLLLEREEVERLRGRYGEVSRVGRLDWAPVASFWDGSILVFDAETRRGMDPPMASPEPVTTNGAPSPVAPPRFRR